MTDFGAAIKLPFSNFKRLSIGAGILILAAVSYIISNFISLIVPIALIGSLIVLVLSMILGFIMTGYMLYCAKNVSGGKFALAEWKNWGDLTLKGFLASIISLIYMLPFIIFSGVLIASLIYKTGFPINTATAMPSFGITELTLLVLTIVFAILAYYLSLMAQVKFINEGFRAAFNLKDVFRRTFTGKYLIGILVLFGLCIAIGLAMLILTFVLAITLIGILLIPVVYGYGYMIMYLIMAGIIGQLYRETSATAATVARSVRSVVVAKPKAKKINAKLKKKK